MAINSDDRSYFSSVRARIASAVELLRGKHSLTSDEQEALASMEAFLLWARENDVR